MLQIWKREADEMTNICKIKFKWLLGMLALLWIVKYIQSLSEQLRIVKSHHIDLTSGHMGFKKTVG